MSIELPAGKILGPYESRDDWLEARKQGLGGSDISAVLGLSSFTSPLQIFYEKTEGATREVSEQMEIGSDIEEWILSRWERTSEVWMDRNVAIDSSLVILQNNEHPWLLHSPDALLRETFDNGGSYRPVLGIEIKNVRSDQHWDPLPEFYMAQVQHGLLCSGLDEWIVVALVGGQRMITRTIHPDLEMQGRIITEGERFWNDHVLAGIPPDPDGSESDSDALNRRWDASGGTVEIADYWFRNLSEASKRKEKAAKEEAKIIQRIKVLMGDAETAKTPDGTKVATWKVGTRTAVDVKRLKEDDPELAHKYEKTTPTRIFRPNL
jgi:putative phage-type endonuclease